MRILILSLMFYLICLISCDKRDHELETVQEHFYKTALPIDNQYRNILIIPDGGCSGCIAEGMNFIKYHMPEFSQGQKKNLIIFTSIKSQKILRRNLGNARLENFNAIIDTADNYLIDFPKNIYPIIIYRSEDGLIEEFDFQSPNNDGLSRLHYKLMEK